MTSNAVWSETDHDGKKFRRELSKLRKRAVVHTLVSRPHVVWNGKEETLSAVEGSDFVTRVMARIEESASARVCDGLMLQALERKSCEAEYFAEFQVPRVQWSLQWLGYPGRGINANGAAATLEEAKRRAEKAAFTLLGFVAET